MIQRRIKMELVEDEKYLKDESEIVEYFTDDGRKFFDCGQGYSQDHAEVVAKIKDRYFFVEIDAEVWGAKQDIGDKLYWVEEITNVSYKEVSYEEVKEWHNKDIHSNITYLEEKIESLKSKLW